MVKTVTQLSQTPNALTALLEQAEKARDEAISQFESGRKAHEAARQQLQSLHDFRQDYQQRWQQRGLSLAGFRIGLHTGDMVVGEVGILRAPRLL